MTQYAQYISSTEIRFPTSADFPGVVNWQYHDHELRNKNFLPLVGEAEDREGYMATPATYEPVRQTKTVTVSRPVFVTDLETDENGNLLLDEEGNPIVSGQHAEYQRMTETADDSFIRVVSWDYVAIEPEPEPEPEPTPVVKYSKLKIVKQMLQLEIWGEFWAALTPSQQVLWNNAQNFSSDYPDFEQGLVAFKAAFPQIDADAMLAECVAD